MIAFLRNAGEWLPLLLFALKHTLLLASLAFVFSLLLGGLLALARLSPFGLLRRASVAYVAFFRAVPLVALLFFLYFSLTQLGVVMTTLSASVTGLTLVNAAYMAEIFRAGVEALPRGQFEAGRAIGLRHHKLAVSVVIPQMIPLILPPLVNQIIILIKETSVTSLIAAPEMMLRAREIANDTFMPLEIYCVVGLIYLAMVLPMSAVGRALEHRLRTA